MTRISSRKQLRQGDTFPGRTLSTVSGAAVPVPGAAELVHLQLRRFAGCPICNVHLHSLTRRRAELEAAGIREVVVFHSPAEELRAHAGDFPFDLVADPEKALYVELGAETSPRSLLDPRVFLPLLRAVVMACVWFVGGKPLPPLRPRGGRLGLPAEFLIAQGGRVVAAKYGEHADDQWSVSELLEHAAREQSLRRPSVDGARRTPLRA